MATAYTSLLGLALPVTGELSGTWGDTVNNSITSLLDSAIAGTTTLSTDADVTLTTTTGASNTSRQAILLCSGARTVLRTITAPAQSKIYTIINATTGGFSVKLVGAGPTTGVTVVAGESAVCAWNGSDFIKISNTSGAGAFTTLSVTGVATFSAGTALLPAITTTGDTNTGIWFPAADTIAFTEGGVESMRLDSAGNLGLGVTPSAWTTFTSAIEVPGGALAGISANQVGVWQNCFYNSSSFKYKSTAAATLYQQAGGTHVWYNAASGTAGNNITFTQAMTLDASGNLGIGTSSPSGKLDVRGTVRATPAAVDTFGFQMLKTGTSTTIAGFYQDTTNNGLLALYNTSAQQSVSLSGASANALTLNSSGNLGLGVTPSATSSGVKSFEMQEVGSGLVSFGSADTVVTSGAFYSSTGWKYAVSSSAVSYYYQSAGKHQWFNAASGTAGNAFTATQAMTLDASGNLLVGTTSGSTKMYVVDTSVSVSTARFFKNVASSQSVGALTIDKFDNTSTTAQIFVQFTINNQGTGSGQINANGASAAAFGSFSDSRLKENITELPSQLANIMALRPVEFDYIESEGGGHQIGFIAQEVQEIYPDLVGERADGMFTLTDMNKNDARLIKAIQEQQALITQLTARITALEGA